MTKTSKKILLVVLIALLTVFALSAKVFATTGEQAIKTYTDVKLQSKNNDVVSISQKDM